MAGRGPQSFKKRQKEQQRREKHQEKIAKRLERKRMGASGGSVATEDSLDLEREGDSGEIEGEDETEPGTLDSIS